MSPDTITPVNSEVDDSIGGGIKIRWTRTPKPGELKCLLNQVAIGPKDFDDVQRAMLLYANSSLTGVWSKATIAANLTNRAKQIIIVSQTASPRSIAFVDVFIF
jgi:hypothetical protein